MYTLIDLAGMWAAVLIMVPVLLLPGYAVGTATNALSFRDSNATLRIGLATLLGLALLPAPLALLSTLIGLGAAMVVTAFLSVAGIVAVARDGLPRPSLRACASAFGALAVLTFAWVDFEFGGRLHQSLLTGDMIKHAAITRGIVDSGMTPPPDPFFARPERASFYYFYFVIPALVETTAQGLIDSRAAVGGAVFWTGVGLAALFACIYRRAGLDWTSHTPALLGLLAALGGVQVFLAAATGSPQVGHTNMQVTPWPLALMWVPHHVAAFVSSWVAFLLLIDAAGAQRHRERIALIVIAGAALASAAGQSIWVTIGTAVSVGIWGCVLIARDRWSAVVTIAAAGLLSLALASPYLVQLLATSATHEAPAIAMEVRPFIITELLGNVLTAVSGLRLNDLLNLLALPANYAYELGVTFVGLVLYWTHRAVRRGPHNDVADLLLISAIVAFVLGSFLKSAIQNNDFGWRVMMFAQVAAMMWTAHVLTAFARRIPAPIASVTTLTRRMPRGVAALVVIGFGAVAYDLVMMRAWPGKGPQWLANFTTVELELRRTFEWINGHVPRTAVVQLNPARPYPHAYALYGRNPIGVADERNAYLLGPRKSVALQRFADVSTIYSSTMGADEIATVARRHGINLLVVAAGDEVWKAKPAWLDGRAVIHSSAHVRVISVDRLDSKGKSS